MNLETGQLVKYTYFDDDDSAIGIITEVGKEKINILWTVEDSIYKISYKACSINCTSKKAAAFAKERLSL